MAIGLGLAVGMSPLGSVSAAPPTYATWNPADKGANVSLSNGNNTATFGAFQQSVRSTIGKASGKWAWETSFSLADGSLLSGIGYITASVAKFPGDDAFGWGIFPSGGGNRLQNNGASVSVSGINPIQQNVPFMLLLDMDAGTLSTIINGVTYSNIVTGLTGTVYALAGNAFGSGNPTITANFGASAFTNTVPSGYNSGLYS